jgi:hypothetical protein
MLSVLKAKVQLLIPSKYFNDVSARKLWHRLVVLTQRREGPEIAELTTLELSGATAHERLPLGVNFLAPWGGFKFWTLITVLT